MLQGLHSVDPTAGEASLALGGIQLSRTLKDMRALFFLSNQRLYEIGAMDGSFPPAGFMLGDQSGVWVPPLKALDGFEFTIRESGLADWQLPPCSRFAGDFATAAFHFARDDWRAERLDFPHPSRPMLFTRLTVANNSDRERTIEIEFKGYVNIRPDWRTTAHNKERIDLEINKHKEGVVWAWDPQLTRSLVVIASNQSETATAVSGAVVRLICRLSVDARSAKAVTFAISGGLDSNDSAAIPLARAIAHQVEEALKTQRTQTRSRMEQGVRFTCSDSELTQAFALAKANVTLLALDCRPILPEIFLAAGVPVYPRLFACDACMALPGAIAGGLWNEAHGTLISLAAQARKCGNLVPHESATDGTLIGPSNAQETTQFIATCRRYYEWTGDRSFITQMFSTLNDAFAAHQKRFHNKGGGYPDGSALVETRGMGPKRIDAACWEYVALSALGDMAGNLGKIGEAEHFAGLAHQLRNAIQRDWWLPAEGMWADSLDQNGSGKCDGLWSVVFPLLTHVASPEQVRLTLDGLQRDWVNRWGGVHTRSPDISRQGSGVVTTNLFAIAAFAAGDPDFGLRMLRLASQAPRQERMPGGFTEMIPPGGSDFLQLWSAGPFLEAVVEGLAGIHPQAAQHRVDILASLPEGLEWFTLENVRIGAHVINLDVRRKDGHPTATLTHTAGPTPLEVRWRLVPVNDHSEGSKFYVAPRETIRLER
jgi:glycogen debranching enzyme